MNKLQQEIDTYRDTWIKLGIDCFAEHPEGKPNEPHRLYLTSKTLGGTLAVNHGEGWLPLWPEKKNYPIKGRFTGWSKQLGWTHTEWMDAVSAALDPQPYLDSINQGFARIAKERAAALRDFFRAQVVIAIIKRMEHTPTQQEG